MIYIYTSEVFKFCQYFTLFPRNISRLGFKLFSKYPRKYSLESLIITLRRSATPTYHLLFQRNRRKIKLKYISFPFISIYYIPSLWLVGSPHCNFTAHVLIGKISLWYPNRTLIKVFNMNSIPINVWYRSRSFERSEIQFSTSGTYSEAEIIRRYQLFRQTLARLTGFTSNRWNRKNLLILNSVIRNSPFTNTRIRKRLLVALSWKGNAVSNVEGYKNLITRKFTKMIIKRRRLYFYTFLQKIQRIKFRINFFNFST